MVIERATRKQLTLTTTFDPQVTTIQADELRLKQILVNLLSNAVKFTPEGGQGGLEVQGDAEQQLVTFTVWDTGIGIAPEEQGRLFQPFVQLDSALNRKYEGTGLGLALVLRLAELHGVVSPWRAPPVSGAASAYVCPGPTRPVRAARHPLRRRRDDPRGDGARYDHRGSLRCRDDDRQRAEEGRHQGQQGRTKQHQADAAGLQCPQGGRVDQPGHGDVQQQQDDTVPRRRR